MSRFKKFLDKRAEGIAKEKEKKEGLEKEIDLNLTDDEFWEISNKFIKENKQSDKSSTEILQRILEKYTPLKIKQFAKRYEELNK